MKKKKILKILLIIVILLLIIFVGYFTRNFIIINKLTKMQEKFDLSNNYSYSVEYYEKNNLISTAQCYYKDGKMFKIDKSFQDNGSNITWYDENTKELIYINPIKLTATIDVFDPNIDTSIDMAIIKPVQFNNSIKDSFRFFITSGKIDSKDYYILNPIIGIIGTTYYYEKEKGVITLCDMGTTIEEDGKEYGGHKIVIKNFKLYQVTDNDVSRPNLTGYEIDYQK